MKISFSFFLLCCMATGNFKTNAQEVFAPIGAEWHYYGSYYSWQGNGEHWSTLYHDVVTGDTIIEGTTCRKIEQLAIAKTIVRAYRDAPTRVFQDTQKLRTLYVYDNADTVFIFNENFNRFTPLYVFNVNEGDTVCLPVIPSTYGYSDLRLHPVSGDTSFCFLIDSIRTVYYDGTPLKTFYTHPLSDWGRDWSDNVPLYNWSTYAHWNQEGVGYAERIGGIQAGIVPVPLGDWIERAVFQSLVVGFRCYSDSSLNIKLTMDDCKELIPDPVSLPGISTHDFSLSVYPNPAKEKITIESLQAFPVNTLVVITDIAGKTVKSQQAGTGKTTITMELDNVQAGIYLLRIDAGKYSVNHKLVIYH